jgi:hypothetical protein
MHGGEGERELTRGAHVWEMIGRSMNDWWPAVVGRGRWRWQKLLHYCAAVSSSAPPVGRCHGRRIKAPWRRLGRDRRPSPRVELASALGSLPPGLGKGDTHNRSTVPNSSTATDLVIVSYTNMDILRAISHWYKARHHNWLDLHGINVLRTMTHCFTSTLLTFEISRLTMYMTFNTETSTTTVFKSAISQRWHQILSAIF